MDIVAQYVVRTLTPALPTVKGRIHRGNLANIPSPVYPLIYFTRAAPGRTDPYAPLDEFRLVFGFCSDQSIDEAKELYESAKPLLDRVVNSQSGQTFYMRRAASPFDNTDMTGKAVYRVLVEYLVRLIA